jgi:hypothetical protein
VTEITEPLNSNAVNYYSILDDGSSSAKTADEKEIFLIKTGATGAPKFEVMRLEEHESCNAEGLQESLRAVTGRMNFSFSRSQKELGMCSLRWRFCQCKAPSARSRGTWSILYTDFVSFIHRCI